MVVEMPEVYMGMGFDGRTGRYYSARRSRRDRTNLLPKAIAAPGPPSKGHIQRRIVPFEFERVYANGKGIERKTIVFRYG